MLQFHTKSMTSIPETPPELQPAGGEGSDLQGTDIFDVSNLLLQILSKLTVYQSLPDSPGLVLSVRDDVPMLDACCMFLPCQSTTVVEVLAPVPQGGDSPTSRGSRLLKKASERADDFPFVKALEAEAARVTSAFASDSGSVDPVGDFLSVDDVLYFLRGIVRNSDSKLPGLTVRQWIAYKSSVTTGEDSEWLRFCETSTLVQRSYLNLSQGVQPNQVMTGSTMNLSSSNLISAGTPRIRKSRTGGSCISAVNMLLNRPWQTSLPLTVSTEKSLTAIFGYTTMRQLMAHVSMNCSDRLLEPFFTNQVNFDSLSLQAEKNLVACPLLDFDQASLGDAIEVLPSNPLVLLVSGVYQNLQGILRVEDVMEQLGKRTETNEELTALGSVRIKDIIVQTENNEESKIYESNFPISLSNLLQKLLMSPADALVVLSQDDVPVGVITSRDVWSYVMQDTDVPQ